MTTSEELTDLLRLARDIFASAEFPGTPEVAVPFDAKVWKSLEQAGLALLSTSEDAGGSGASLTEAAQVLRVSAQCAAAVPLAETDFLAAWLLDTAGLPVPAGPLTVAHIELDATSGPVCGDIARVPWGRNAESVVLLGTAGQGTFVSAGVPSSVSHGCNVGYEPRDSITFDYPDRVAVDGSVVTEYRRRGALVRAIQISGALETALDSTIAHANERTQFGRALGKFQAVQHMVAEAAGEVAVASVATDTALATVESDGFLSDTAGLAIAVARSCAGRAAEIVARNAHQVHGAIGFTLDHSLRRSTMCALGWRDEFGTQREWNRVVGEYGRRSSGSRMGLWHMMTGDLGATIG